MIGPPTIRSFVVDLLNVYESVKNLVRYLERKNGSDCFPAAK